MSQYLNVHPESGKCLVDNLKGTVSRLASSDGWLAYDIDLEEVPESLPELSPVELGSGKEVATTQEFELLSEGGEALGSGRVTNDTSASQ